MATKTIPAPKQQRIRMTELSRGVTALPAGQSRVDREAGIIRGVRVIGQISDNGRRYTLEALRKAIPLYSGAKVKFDHPPRPDDPRPVLETFGWLENVRQGEDGALYADLHFVKEHPHAAFVCEVAERNPALLGLSHNASGNGQNVDGVFIVSEIEAVESVDLVDRPATNTSLFEQRQPMKKKLRTWLEEAQKTVPAKLLTRYKKLVEEMPPEMLDEEDDMPGEQDWVACLKDAMSKMAGTPDGHEKAKKVMAMLEPQKVEEDDEEMEEDEDDEDMEEEEDSKDAEDKEDKDEGDEELPGPKDKRTKESRKPRKHDEAKHLREQLKLRDQIEAAGLTFVSVARRQAFIECLLPLSPASRKELIEERKELAKAQATTTTKQPPRSQLRHQVTEETAPAVKVTDGKSLVEFLKS